MIRDARCLVNAENHSSEHVNVFPLDLAINHREGCFTLSVQIWNHSLSGENRLFLLRVRGLSPLDWRDSKPGLRRSEQD